MTKNFKKFTRKMMRKNYSNFSMISRSKIKTKIIMIQKNEMEDLQMNFIRLLEKYFYTDF
jgi:hypothetical protein